MNWPSFAVGLALGLFAPPAVYFFAVMVAEFREAGAARRDAAALRREEQKRIRFDEALRKQWETR